MLKAEKKYIFYRLPISSIMPIYQSPIRVAVTEKRWLIELSNRLLDFQDYKGVYSKYNAGEFFGAVK